MSWGQGSSSTRPSRVRVIFNPTAAGGRGRRREAEIRPLLTRLAGESGSALEWTATQAPGHAVALAEQAALDGCDLVVAVGGDGTLNEVVNGLLRSGDRDAFPTVGVVPIGSGNDFAWSAGIPLNPVAACWRLFAPEIQPCAIDVGQVREADGRERYFVNGCGAGFDGRVALEVERLKWLRGFLIYLVAVLKTLVLHHQVPRLRIQVDERAWTQPSMMVTVGNGRRLGGGFLVTPEAELDDGLLDVCIAGRLSRLGILMILPRFMRGTHVTHSQIQMDRARRVRVASPETLAVHLDGENFAVDARELEFGIVPNGLRLVI